MCKNSHSSKSLQSVSNWCLSQVLSKNRGMIYLNDCIPSPLTNVHHTDIHLCNYRIQRFGFVEQVIVASHAICMPVRNICVRQYFIPLMGRMIYIVSFDNAMKYQYQIWMTDRSWLHCCLCVNHSLHESLWPLIDRQSILQAKQHILQIQHTHFAYLSWACVSQTRCGMWRMYMITQIRKERAEWHRSSSILWRIVVLRHLPNYPPPANADT